MTVPAGQNKRCWSRSTLRLIPSMMQRGVPGWSSLFLWSYMTAPWLGGGVIVCPGRVLRDL